MESNITYVIPVSSQKPKIVSLVPNDPGSRYKCRQLQVQIVGKSKMIRTVLVNILDVAKDMQIPPSYPGNYMGYEIGAQAKFDSKKPERQQAFLSGEHELKDLSKIAQKFINEVILCPQCGLPEITIEIANKKIIGVCRACGGREELKITNEKFKRFVLNHPPKTLKGAFDGKQDVKKSEAKEKKTITKEKKNKEANGNSQIEDNSNQEGEEIVWFSDTSSEAARKRREEMLPEALRGPKKTLDKEEIRKLIEEENVEKLEEEKKSSETSNVEFIQFLFKTISKSSAKDLGTKYKKVFKHFSDTSEEQIAFLEAFEAYCGKNSSLISEVPLILKHHYDEDIASEENILAWFKNESGQVKAVREHATPFIKWLEEAEEESDSDEDDE